VSDSSTWDTFNKHLHFLKEGDLVIVDANVLKKYNLSPASKLTIGILVSDKLNTLPGWDSPEINRNIIYDKLYKVMILNKVITIGHSDIKELIE